MWSEMKIKTDELQAARQEFYDNISLEDYKNSSHTTNGKKTFTVTLNGITITSHHYILQDTMSDELKYEYDAHSYAKMRVYMLQKALTEQKNGE